MDSRKFIPQAEAARRLEVSVPTFSNLTKGLDPLVRTNPAGRGVSLADVQHLASMPPMAALPADHLPILRVPKKPELLGPSMYLERTDHMEPAARAERENDLRKYTELWAANPASKRHPYDGAAVCFTGYWETSQDNVDQLVQQGGVIVSTVAGFADQVARVLGHVTTIAFRNRKVLAVAPLSGTEATTYRLNYGPARQTPDFYA